MLRDLTNLCLECFTIISSNTSINYLIHKVERILSICDNNYLNILHDYKSSKRVRQKYYSYILFYNFISLPLELGQYIYD